MGQYQRHDFSLGWNPSVDAFKCPANALLRMDNLTLDELGAVSLRHGSAKINSSALSSTDCHSLFTTTISGTRYRMVGASSGIFANNTNIVNGVTGSGDISFGAHMGHILFARGTTKKKYDGTTVRTWGIAPPNAAPTLSVLSADSLVFASCASTESPAMSSNEGTQSFAADLSGTANAAVEIQPDTTTGRGVSTKTFAGATDFTVYSGGQIGTDDDVIDFYCLITEPQYVTDIFLMIDVNDGAFQEDYYEYHFKPGDSTGITQSVDESLESNYDVVGANRLVVKSKLTPADPPATTETRSDKPSSNTGWNHFAVPRGKMERRGVLTSGKNWATVKAVRVGCIAIAGGSGAAVRFDAITIRGGAARPLTGKFKAAVVAVRNDGTYNAVSAPSAYSSEIEVKAQGIRATVASGVVAALDSQVNELWLFLMGGGMDNFYLATKKTGGPFSGAQTIDATSSVITMMSANIVLDLYNSTPPDSIIGIEGPHYDRTLCLTSQFLFPSRQLNPDSFNVDSTSAPTKGEAVRVGDATETALWIKKLGENGLYVGTTRDIYRMDGDWTPYADGSINVVKRPLHVSNPPISAAVTVGTVNGVETLIYLASNGWNAIGAGPIVNGSVDLLWRGLTRHGVSPVNIATSSARFRCAIAKNILYAITPEGSSTTSSATIHAYHFGQQRWYRFTYPQAFRSILAEADGTLIAGDASGFIRTLDSATHQDDGADISVVMWTGVDDNGEPFTSKELRNLWMRVDTDDDTASVAFHLDGSDSSSLTTTTAQSASDTANVDVSELDACSQVQLRITGSFSTFLFRGWGASYLDNPMPQMIHDTGNVDLSIDAIKWLRKLRIKAKATADLTVQPYWDGIAGTARTVTITAPTYGKPTVFDVPLGRDDKCKVARVVITSADPSQVYWVEFQYSGTGKQIQKRVTLTPEAA